MSTPTYEFPIPALPEYRILAYQNSKADAWITKIICEDQLLSDCRVFFNLDGSIATDSDGLAIIDNGFDRMSATNLAHYVATFQGWVSKRVA